MILTREVSMAIDINSLIADALLRLCQQKHLKKSPLPISRKRAA